MQKIHYSYVGVVNGYYDNDHNYEDKVMVENHQKRIDIINNDQMIETTGFINTNEKG